jgi:hypothetical protein
MEWLLVSGVIFFFVNKKKRKEKKKLFFFCSLKFPVEIFSIRRGEKSKSLK